LLPDISPAYLKWLLAGIIFSTIFIIFYYFYNFYYFARNIANFLTEKVQKITNKSPEFHQIKLIKLPIARTKSN